MTVFDSPLVVVRFLSDHHDSLDRADELEIDRVLTKPLKQHCSGERLYPGSGLGGVRNIHLDCCENVSREMPLVPPETVRRIVREAPKHTSSEVFCDLPHRLVELSGFNGPPSPSSIGVICEWQRSQDGNEPC